MMLRVTAKAESKDEADSLMLPVINTVWESLGDIVYGIDTDSLENTVALLLREHNMTLATAESCTGGLVSKRLTDIPGISNVYLGGFTVYSDFSKAALLGISEDLIKEKGAVSSEVALAMADNVRVMLDADIGVGITGIAGPGRSYGDPRGADTGEPSPCVDAPEVGTVFVALTTGDSSFCRSLKLFFDRDRIRISAASNAFDMIRRFLTGLDVISNK
jgi:nicotinamide-nucleotide amidase